MAIPFDDNDEIDLNIIFKSIRRNTKQLFILTSTSTIIIFSYLLTMPPIWRGSFNILVKRQNFTEKYKPQQSLITRSTLNFNPIDNTNETQKLILQSPLVLKPVFEYVLDYKKNKNGLNNSLTFKSWVESLKVDFENNSNVLNITHENSDKELLINTLNLISKNYKEYSKKEQIQSILDTKKYLESQKKIMTEKSAISQSNFNKFALENRLGNFDGLIVDFQKNPNIDFSKQDNDQIQNNFGSRYQSQFLLLNQLEAEFTNLSKYLKPNSKTLKKLNEEIKYLKKSLERPNEIFLKYKELSGEALRDATLLSNIETNLELTKLEQIKTPNPWQLISTPTIDRNPISPSKSKKLFISLTLSTLLASIFILLKEKLVGFLFNKSEIKSKLNTKYLQTINKKEDDLTIKLILNYFNIKDSTKESLVGIINYHSKADLSPLKEKLSNYPNILILDFLDKRIDTIEKLIIILEEGKLNNNDINSLNKYISIYKNKIVGWFYFTE